MPKKVFKTVKTFFAIGKNQINVTEIDGVKHLGFVGTFSTDQGETEFMRGGTFINKENIPALEAAIAQFKQEA